MKYYNKKILLTLILTLAFSSSGINVVTDNSLDLKSHSFEDWTTNLNKRSQIISAYEDERFEVPFQSVLKIGEWDKFEVEFSNTDGDYVLVTEDNFEDFKDVFIMHVISCI